jgi:hypothetical protein
MRLSQKLRTQSGPEQKSEHLSGKKWFRQFEQDLTQGLLSTLAHYHKPSFYVLVNLFSNKQPNH